MTDFPPGYGYGINCPACDVSPGELHQTGCAAGTVFDRGGGWFSTPGCFPKFVDAQFVVRDDGALTCAFHDDCKGIFLGQATVPDADGICAIRPEHPQMPTEDPAGKPW